MTYKIYIIYIWHIPTQTHTPHRRNSRLTKKNAGRGLLWSPPKVMMFLSPLYLQHTLAYVTIYLQHTSAYVVVSSKSNDVLLSTISSGIEV